MRFIDSMRFMRSSLEALAGNLTKDKFNATQKCFGDRSELMLRKGVYPYDSMDGPTKLEETQLPPKEEFYSKLYDAHITDEDYAHVHRVFKTLSCQNIMDDHNLYLESDVAILEDVFEDFRVILCASNTTNLTLHTILHLQG